MIPVIRYYKWYNRKWMMSRFEWDVSHRSNQPIESSGKKKNSFSFCRPHHHRRHDNDFMDKIYDMDKVFLSFCVTCKDSQSSFDDGTPIPLTWQVVKAIEATNERYSPWPWQIYLYLYDSESGLGHGEDDKKLPKPENLRERRRSCRCLPATDEDDGQSIIKKELPSNVK